MTTAWRATLASQASVKNAVSEDYAERFRVHLRLADWAEVTRKPLFGAIALRRNDLVFGMISKGGLYFKTDERWVLEYDAASSDKLRYSQGEKTQSLKSFAEVPPEVSEDDEKLREWADVAYKAALESAAGK